MIHPILYHLELLLQILVFLADLEEAANQLS